MSGTLNSFVVANPNQCIGCKVCEIVCFAVHNKNNQVAMSVGTIAAPVIPRLYLVRGETFTMPIQCRHCEDAPCANSCRIGAIKQEDKRIVIDENDCIGCKTCLLACPFGAIDLLPQFKDGEAVIQANLKEESEFGLEEKVKTIAYKCDLCQDHGEPACVTACPQQALTLVIPAEEKKRRNRQAAVNLLSALN
ncbi:hydrogenase-4 component A [Desulfosporosinus acididurans]|uniref:Hydrogenase-4 component A n=1 Tax=Desulfosporosinus acididurans TaxID=476652 RepID=A0A0J1FR02_9FIRM|nr:4Fe-4S dicluster domain-containing protein [Desulfosporosinus acididurans]KLU65925.1 hydrogenase-4 component A [Desulfosporosinus acididurans]